MRKRLRASQSLRSLWTTVILCFVPLAAPLAAQVDATMPLDVRLWRAGATARVVDLPNPAPPAPATAAAAGTISADLLRCPLPEQARQLLLKARRAAEAGDHPSAIQRLTAALAKYPKSAAWIQPVLGVEYLKTDQFEAAVKTLEQAVLLLPRDAISRSNFGLSLAASGRFDRAEQELHRALELDGSNLTIRNLLQIVETEHRLRAHD